MYCVTQLQTSWLSVSANSSHQPANRLSCKQRNDASRTSKLLCTDTGSFSAPRANAGPLLTFSGSLSTVTMDTGSFRAPRTNAGPLLTFSGSLQTPRTTDRSVPSHEIVHDAVSTKKMKVEVDDIEFENDFDTEMMMMMAQTTELQNCSHSSSSSRVAGSLTAAWDSSRVAGSLTWDGSKVAGSLTSDGSRSCNVSATNVPLKSSEHVKDSSRRDLTETSSRTASDSRISYSTMHHDITGSRQSENADRRSFKTDGDMMDVKDVDIMDVKHYSVNRHNSAESDVRRRCGGVAMTTDSASAGNVQTELVFSLTLLISYLMCSVCALIYQSVMSELLK